VKDRSLFRALEAEGVAIDPAWSAAFVDRSLPAPARADLIRARDVIGNWSHTHIDDLLLKAGVVGLDAGEEIGTREKRAITIAKFTLEHPGAKTADDRLFSTFVVEETLGAFPGTSMLDGADEANPASSSPAAAERLARASTQSANRVFVVHGQNEHARDDVVQFLRTLGLNPIVLHEQPNMGRHLLTKLIEEAELVTFAVILMTDDDVGSKRGDEQLRARARLKVILELGYLLSHRGRESGPSQGCGGASAGIPEAYQGRFRVSRLGRGAIFALLFTSSGKPLTQLYGIESDSSPVGLAGLVVLLLARFRRPALGLVVSGHEHPR
jgi:hypothetical protein